jgi:hypothetical protein
MESTSGVGPTGRSSSCAPPTRPRPPGHPATSAANSPTSAPAADARLSVIRARAEQAVAGRRGQADVADRHGLLARSWTAVETFYRQQENELDQTMTARQDWEAATQETLRLAAAADTELRRRQPGRRLKPLRSAEPVVTEAEREQLIVTPGELTYDQPEWISALADERRKVQQRLSERQVDNPLHGYDAQPQPVWAMLATTPSSSHPSRRSGQPHRSWNAPPRSKPKPKLAGQRGTRARSPGAHCPALSRLAWLRPRPAQLRPPPPGWLGHDQSSADRSSSTASASAVGLVFAFHPSNAATTRRAATSSGGTPASPAFGGPSTNVPIPGRCSINLSEISVPCTRPDVVRPTPCISVSSRADGNRSPGLSSPRMIRSR